MRKNDRPVPFRGDPVRGNGLDRLRHRLARRHDCRHAMRRRARPSSRTVLTGACAPRAGLAISLSIPAMRCQRCYDYCWQLSPCCWGCRATQWRGVAHAVSVEGRPRSALGGRFSWPDGDNGHAISGIAEDESDISTARRRCWRRCWRHVGGRRHQWNDGGRTWGRLTPFAWSAARWRAPASGCAQRKYARGFDGYRRAISAPKPGWHNRRCLAARHGARARCRN